MSFPSPLSGKFWNSILFCHFSSSLGQYCQNFVYFISFLKESSYAFVDFFLFDLCSLCHYYMLIFIICFLLLILKFCTFLKKVNQSNVSLQVTIFYKSHLWWLILCVNLTGSWDAQLAGKTWFLGVSVRGFQEEVSFWIGRLRKEDHPHQPHQCKQASSKPLRAWIEQKGGSRVNLLSLLELRHLSSPAFRHWCSCFSG